MSGEQKRQLSALGIVVALLVGALVVAGVVRFSESPLVAAASEKHTICHRTASTTNPYRRITVSRNAVYSGASRNFRNSKHPIHDDYPFKSADLDGDGFLHDETAYSGLLAAASDVDGDTIVNSDDNDFNGVGIIAKDVSGNITSIQVNPTDNVFRSGWTYPSNQKKWGDIIPPISSGADELNYGADGQAIFNNSSGCARMSPEQFVQVQSVAGVPLAEIMADLDEQAASDDLALVSSLGTSFTTWYSNNSGATLADFTSMVESEKPSVDTLDPTDVLTTSAQLRGNVSPKGVQSTFYFQLSTSSATVPDATRENTGMKVNGSLATSSNSTSSLTVTLDKTGLTNGQTYYYRIIGVAQIIDPDGNGTDTVESIAEGEVVSFVMGAPSVATSSPTNVQQTSATFNGASTPNSTLLEFSFQYSTTSGGVASAASYDTGMLVGGVLGNSSSSSSNVTLSASVAGLQANTTYYYRLRGKKPDNSYVNGSIVQFTTLANPNGTTEPESNVTQTTATLNGTVSPNGVQTDLYFQWATSAGAVASAPTVSAGMTIGGSSATTSASNSTLNVSMPISGLTAGTQYYYRLIGFLASDNSQAFVGSNEDFRTSNNNPGPPVAPPSSGPSTTVKTQGPPAKVVNPSGGGGIGGGGNGGPPDTDPRTGGSDPIEEKVIVQVGPTLPAGGGGGGGGGGGSIRIAPQPNEPPLELLDATIEDPEYEIEVVRSGTDYNKPETWVKDGFGDECWKFEPGGSSYVLPDPPVAPSGKAGAVYSAVKVKAGSLTSDDPNFQVNTLFLEPAPGSMVWPDSNKDGVYNPGGRTGDKEISHVIVCVRFGTPSAPSTTVPGTTAAPTTSPSTSAPSTTTAPTTTSPNSTTSAPTTTAAPATTTVAPPAIPTTSVPEETPEIEIAVRKIQSNPEDPTTTTTTAPSGPRERKISLTVTNGFKQSKLEIVVDLDRFIMTDGNVPLPQLPKTGDDTNRPLQLAVAALAIGAALVLVRRRLRLN